VLTAIVTVATLAVVLLARNTSKASREANNQLRASEAVNGNLKGQIGLRRNCAQQIEDSFRPRRHLLPDREGDPPGQERRHRVADLQLDLSPIASEMKVVGEALQSCQFRVPEPAILPVEWADVWTRLALEGCSWPAGIELQENRPVARPPLE